MNLTLLIDLDDTLLPNSTEKFIPAYLTALSDHLSELAPPQQLQESLIKATRKAIAGSDPTITIKQAFDQNFYQRFGTNQEVMQDKLLDFYTNEYRSLSPIAAPDPEVLTFIQRCLLNGYQLAIATNPIFPKIATYERLRWAGLSPDDHPFVLISTYEDFHFAKPHPAYFMEFLAQIGWPENQIVVIGNDLKLDILPAQEMGISTYWVTDDYTKISCLKKHGAGSLNEFHSWLETQTEESLTPDLTSFNASLETIRSTPAALLSFLNKIQPQTWYKTPNENSWSITEIICHLRDVDSEVHVPRFKMLRDEPTPFLYAINADTWAEERSYQNQDGMQALNDFLDARTQLIELISSMPKSVELKDIRHTNFGPITLDEIMKIAARHDRLHIQQLSTLINK